jgi:glycosyltransferase involved in cell wall biosynthesis
LIFDDGSTDRSVELLTASGKVEMRRLASGPSSTMMQLEEMNRCWKESRGRADWVITCDIDEQLYHPKGLRNYLERCRAEGVTILDPIGYDMVSANFPEPNSVLTESIRCGVRTSLLDKKSVFDPNAIEQINYTAGRHVAEPTGRIAFPEEREVMLLHFKHLGLEYLSDRSTALKGRKTDFDREHHWGVQYYRSTEVMKSDFEQMLHNAEDVIA